MTAQGGLAHGGLAQKHIAYFLAPHTMVVTDMMLQQLVMQSA